jgi:hypothetical protein
MLVGTRIKFILLLISIFIKGLIICDSHILQIILGPVFIIAISQHMLQ